jgi:hypothetical protein
MASGFGISAKEWQLLSFFEVEPTRLDADMPWPYNEFTYRRCLGNIVVSFAVTPSSKDFTLTVERDAEKHLELTVLQAYDIRYREEGEVEWLEILVTENHRLEMRIKPSFSIVGSGQTEPHSVPVPEMVSWFCKLPGFTGP